MLSKCGAKYFLALYFKEILTHGVNAVWSFLVFITINLEKQSLEFVESNINLDTVQVKEFFCLIEIIAVE